VRLRRRVGELRLHLGCGSTVVPNWENIDKSPTIMLSRVPGLRRALATARILTPDQANAVFPSGIVHADVRHGLLRYEDATVRYIYSSHMIEHMPRWQGLALVKECRRVLMPDGVLRLATPDLAQVVDAYRSGVKGDAETAADAFMGGLGTFIEQPGSRVQRLLQRLFAAPHQWLYDEQSLILLLEEAGFFDVSVRGFRDSALPDIALLEHRDGLFVEAGRPRVAAREVAQRTENGIAAAREP
jgi:SAM-dependent methyltransferase